jgi:hypothetical protein
MDWKPHNIVPIRARCYSMIEVPIKDTSISSAHPAVTRPGAGGVGRIASGSTTIVVGMEASGCGGGTEDAWDWAVI